MRLTTIVRVSQNGSSGESCVVGRISNDYSDDYLANRVKKQFETAKEELNLNLEERRKAKELQGVLF
jgi:hypothetical protein